MIRASSFFRLRVDFSSMGDVRGHHHRLGSTPQPAAHHNLQHTTTCSTPQQQHISHMVWTVDRRPWIVHLPSVECSSGEALTWAPACIG
jgi:hypothetical protein